MAAPRAGAMDQLAIVDIPTAPVGPGQVEVRIVDAAVNPADLKVLRGELAGRFLHARTKPLLSGYDFSGVVESCGTGVTDLTPGTEVFGFLAYAGANRQGGYSERVVVDRDPIAVKPSTVSHADAAACGTPALTALQSFRDLGKLRAGGRVLVMGAAGGVGSLAVGVARGLGAHVTGVCSTYAVEFVKSLGADEVVDRKVRDPLELTGPYDVVLDAAAAYSYASTRHMLAPDGAYVTTLPGPGILAGKLMTLFSKRRCTFVVVKSLRADLEQVAAWMVEGKVKVALDARFPVRELSAALAKATKGEVKGRIAVDVANGW